MCQVFLTVAFITLQLAAASSKQLNIHVKVLNPNNVTISKANLRISAGLTNPEDQKIHFETTHDPHATLYLTTFLEDSLDEMVTAANAALQSGWATFCTPCSFMSIGDTKVAGGSYGMLEVINTDCLQGLSDSLVNATCEFIDPKAKEYVPGWVYDLPDEERDMKIDLIHKYGSPNVFGGFQPHVTLVGDSISSSDMNQVFDTTPFQPIVETLNVVGFGSVGEFGTVLKGMDIAEPVVLGGNEEKEEKQGCGESVELETYTATV
mmetsp:Transcript_23825/g.49638  ORF Transcript_23825/g.49638 Transcript_23825/m.49638 type:complete len:264 (-) Transcript_23825:27-818(-)